MNELEKDPSQYEPPALTDYGDLTTLTAGSNDGTYLDADYPAGTLKGALGFSG